VIVFDVGGRGLALPETILERTILCRIQGDIMMAQKLPQP